MTEVSGVIDLGRLAPRAIVAYAARCARRVQPLLQRDAPGAEQLANTEREIALAERFAAGQGISAADIGDPALSSPPSGAARAA